MILDDENRHSSIAVIIPAFRCQNTIIKVIEKIPDFVDTIIVVDDASPDRTKEIITNYAPSDRRIHYILHKSNQGVGGAMLTGYSKGIELGADILVKMDSDDQMDSTFLPHLIRPLVIGKADFTKGNRFIHMDSLRLMPWIRRLGNLVLSFLVKAASGYWNIFDPTNGYIAIRSSILSLINKERIDKRFFFEISMLFELRLVRAVVKDVYIPARYYGEISSLSIVDTLVRFPPKLIQVLIKRLLIEYFIRDFTSVSLLLILGILMSVFGLIFGIVAWVKSASTGIPATTGSVMIAVLPLILGVQFLIQAALQDINNIPSECIWNDPWINHTSNKMFTNS